MAKVLNPLLSTDASGTASGLTFGTNRGQKIVRLKPNRSRRLNVTLSEQRNRMGWFARSWSQLTNAERETWKAYARSVMRVNKQGVVFAQTGLSAFCQLNSQKVNAGIGLALIRTAPAGQYLTAMQTLALSNLAPIGGFRVDFTTQNVGGATGRIEYQVTREATSQGRMQVNNRWRPIVSRAQTPLNFNVTGLRTDAWYWFRIRCVGTYGVVSGWLIGQIQAK